MMTAMGRWTGPSPTDAATWYEDSDGDGYGNVGVAQRECVQPVGYVSNSTDCDDAAWGVNPTASEVCNTIDDDCDGTVDGPQSTDAATWYEDSDGDGYGNVGVAQRECVQPVGYVSNSTDCDDAASGVNPTASEVCNTIDDDCDGTVDGPQSTDAATWYEDSDGDGYGNVGVAQRECVQPVGYVSNSTDCDDAASGVNPTASEVCNTIDDDCDGTVDGPQSTDAATWYEDSDGDGYGNVGVAQRECVQPVGYVSNSTDCDDAASGVNPTASEVCNTIDDDCDGTVDGPQSTDAATWYEDSDGDGYGNVGVAQRECVQPVGYVSNSTDCDDAASGVNPTASEVCNTIDDDCDGTVDGPQSTDAATWYEDSDGDGYGNVGVAQRECVQPVGYVSNSTDCDDAASGVNPTASEVCNTIDDDCDGTVDGPQSTDAATWYEDSDGDGYGNVGVAQRECVQPVGYVSNSTDCDDAASGVNPTASEVCNTIDDDCDGTVDGLDAVDIITWFGDRDADGFGDSATFQQACDQPDGFVLDSTDCNDQMAEINPGQPERCDDDDVDENCNGIAEEEGALGTKLYLVDADLDGFGEVGSVIAACQTGEGIVELDGDCDDADDSVYPGAPEDCVDRRDTNCDGFSGADDLDNDGFAVCDECDDQSAARYPGAEEICDGVDNDCDREVDNDAVDALIFYADRDSDGFGAAEIRACELPPFAVEQDGDCDDDNRFVYPGAFDVANDGIDQNCDGADRVVVVSGPDAGLEPDDGSEGLGCAAPAQHPLPLPGWYSGSPSLMGRRRR